MILSRTSQYAVQAMIYMATQPPGAPVLNKDIAARLNVPAPYLAKILQSLSKGGLLYSFRGRLGGFCLREEAAQVSLMQLLQLTEGADFTQSCLLGLKRCSDETACPVHARWLPIKEKVIEMLNQMSLADLATAVQSGRYRLADMPIAALPTEP
ncbi:Rrf2 family transcriptional regulator [Sulfuriferula sp. AH1]|uniref:RrF2 family transcriptional regulator n=1 Tax=Sulfuriferula sp. AH1 TaxID=1985873 RepID=UPI000B3B7FB1|nr:Rrf2 family transcriptional regulator [Sulfuriferula sp. AH1]ARU32600.1 Rrf2 family transcriptional regulator [Sulfuriferula sp. AH1]